ncbi:MAG: serine/threonine-protein kinase, partial [Rubrivivax sp.]|nr:serine/threonine-protein kinase [Rubrivivax sp.]
MTADPLPWPQIKAVFDAAVDLPAANRETLIAAAALDAAALAELRSLLAHHDVATEQQVFMAKTAAQQLVEAAARVGQRLGAWEIVRAIGSGGMGEVFEASRADGSYQGRAAVKLLKRGMDSAAVLQRFALERQALARLSHPHIARLLDAGASDEGLPYFVLEYVDGQAIDEAVRSLSIDARLRLFLQLADAVSHAHRNLLVHRDLKPGNVLVDSEGQVKLLDFGIAKALDPLEGHDGQTTVGGQRPYTPHYASPEQVRGEPVTTATDIYSLGVLLYQMLTGTRPTGRHATTPAEAARSVLEDEPTRPSRLSPSEAVDPQWLQTRKRLEGDLDNILLKALEKAADRRYASVDALAADVLAYLQGRPVSARPAQLGYVLGKFVRRNRWAVVAGALGGLGLLAGLAAALLQGRVAMVVGLLGMALGLGLALLQAERARRAQRSAAEQLGHVKDLLRGLVLRYSYGVWLTPKGGRLMRAFVEDA